MQPPPWPQLAPRVHAPATAMAATRATRATFIVFGSHDPGERRWARARDWISRGRLGEASMRRSGVRLYTGDQWQQKYEAGRPVVALLAGGRAQSKMGLATAAAAPPATRANASCGLIGSATPWCSEQKAEALAAGCSAAAPAALTVLNERRLDQRVDRCLSGLCHTCSNLCSHQIALVSWYVGLFAVPGS